MFLVKKTPSETASPNSNTQVTDKETKVIETSYKNSETPSPNSNTQVTDKETKVIETSYENALSPGANHSTDGPTGLTGSIIPTYIGAACANLYNSGVDLLQKIPRIETSKELNAIADCDKNTLVTSTIIESTDFIQSAYKQLSSFFVKFTVGGITSKMLIDPTLKCASYFLEEAQVNSNCVNNYKIAWLDSATYLGKSALFLTAFYFIPMPKQYGVSYKMVASKVVSDTIFNAGMDVSTFEINYLSEMISANYVKELSVFSLPAFLALASPSISVAKIPIVNLTPENINAALEKYAFSLGILNESGSELVNLIGSIYNNTKNYIERNIASLEPKNNPIEIVLPDSKNNVVNNVDAETSPFQVIMGADGIPE